MKCEKMPFVKNEYKSYMLIDFAHMQREVREIFDNDKNDFDLFFNKLSAYYRTPLYQRETLIIFDEVQRYPAARELVKYLVADGRYDYLETGSLISLRMNVENTRPLGQAVHKRVLNDFRQYMLVGGMPQAVESYIKDKNFENVDRIKKRILTLYREDITKFAKGYEAKVLAVFDEMPSQLSKVEKKFKLSSIDTGARFRDYESSFMWLAEAMIANNCYNATEPTVGLAMSKEHTTRKCYMGDTGLLITHSFMDDTFIDNELYRDILLDRLHVNEGMLMENIVAQELRAHGHKLFFYSRIDTNNRENNVEIDFLIRRQRKICPIEVKSGAYRKHSSLDKFRKRFSGKIGQSYILYTKDICVKEEVVHLPLYFAMFL